MNGPQALYVIPGCFKCISGTKLSHANKSLFTIALILHFQNKLFAMGKSVKIGIFIPIKLPNDALAFCPLINFDFLLLHIAHFDKSIIFLFQVFTDFVFFLHIEQ